MTAIDYQKALENARRVLEELEAQAAGYTVLTIPPSLVLELEEQRKKVARLEELAAGKVPDLVNTLPRRQPFFGREAEIARLLEALSPEDRGWGAMIDGIGGIGKTALATEVAHLCLEQARFDAFLFVTAKETRLTPGGEQEVEESTRSLDGMLDEIARSLDDASVPRHEGRAKRKAFLDLLRRYSGPERRVLLIFDNLETLPPADQVPLFELLRRLPQHCKAIVTSRRRAGEGGVWVRLERLDWPTARQIIADRMHRSSRLEQELRRVGEGRWQELYDLTGGSPLALTWALGLMDVRHLSFDRLLEMLRGAEPDSPLHAFVYREARREMGGDDWRVLGALAYFVLPATFEALAAVTDMPRRALEAALERLEGYALVDAETADGPYSLHPLTRQLALGELAGQPEGAALRARFVRYWVDYARRYGGSSKNYKTFDRLEATWPNLEAAAAQLWAMTGLPAALWDEAAAGMLNELARVLSSFLWFRGYWDEVIRLATWAYEAMVAAGRWRDAGWRAYNVAWIHYLRKETERAEAWARRMTEAMEKGGSRRGFTFALRLRGGVARQRGDLEEAERRYAEALEITRELEAREDEAIIFNSLGELMREDRKEYDKAEVYYRAALEIAEQRGDKKRQAARLSNLGLLALDRERWKEARTYFERALPLAQEMERQVDLAVAKWGLARVLEEEGRYAEALPLAEEALRIAERLRHGDVDKFRELVARLREKVK